MKKGRVSALIVSVALLGGLGVTSAMAKCGGAPAEQPAMKCGTGKCGDSMKMEPKEKTEKKAEKPVMKCGAGKCGGSMKMETKEQ